MHLRSFSWAEPGFIYQTWDEYTNRWNSGNVIALIVNGLEKEPISSKLKDVTLSNLDVQLVSVGLVGC